jgi:hypothetical protein
MRLFLVLGTAVSLLAAGLPACQPRPSADTAQARPPAAAEASAPSRSSGAVDAGPAPTAPAAADPCVIADRAERSELRRCDVDTLAESEWDVESSLEITASPAKVTTTPGGIGDLVVHYANKTDAPVVLVFDDTVLRGHVVAHHADGRRADGTEAPPPVWATSWAKGARRYQRVTLGPKAVLDERKMWFAESWKWAPNAHEKQYPRSLLGPLPKGSYTLRVRSQLIVRSTGHRVDYAEARTNAAVE